MAESNNQEEKDSKTKSGGEAEARPTSQQPATEGDSVRSGGNLQTRSAQRMDETEAPKPAEETDQTTGES
jgi:hypothetical protein